MQNLVTIKRNGNYLAVSDAKKPYLLGFTNTRDANLIKDELQLCTSEYQVYIRSDAQRNISWNIKKTMLEVNLPIYNIAEEVMIDNEATVIFPKHDFDTQKDIRVIENGKNIDCTLYHVKYDRFIQIPMRNNIGLLLPYKQIHVDENMYIYNACLVNSFIRNDVNDIWK